MHSPQTQSQPSLLSARQVQTMLGVDRSTVYRMAEDGRLPAVKVGRQWRFPADRIEAVLRVDAAPRPASGREPAAAASVTVPAPSTEVAASVAQIAADLLGVMMVVTDMDGRPITEVSNPCPWFVERSDDPDLLDACVAEWQQLADDTDFEPRFTAGVLGFECARAFVRSGTSLVAMVLVGGVAPAGSTTTGLYRLDDEGRRRVLAALPKVAATLSRIGPRTPDARTSGRRTTDPRTA
ncbi:helix-turn-helix domain-containing protein [Kineosporia sp. A_224]|uniref:helix-turn-helix domain-containing protein n=1 Tax=Kineosporia sp. A_224 TaxID=1962180 RepID=UPI00117AA8AD|nr:helix-turn-helix domain-containing protein [Kineosporia sp. A_224]